MSTFKHNVSMDMTLEQGGLIEHWTSDSLPYILVVTRHEGEVENIRALPKSQNMSLYCLIAWKTPNDQQWHVAIDQHTSYYTEMTQLALSDDPIDVRHAAEAGAMAAKVIEAIYADFFSIPDKTVEKMLNALNGRYAYIYAHGGSPIRTPDQVPEQKRAMLTSVGKPDDEWQHGINTNMWWSHSRLGQEIIDPVLGKLATGELVDKRFIDLHKKLLSFGGVETCFPAIEEDMEAILTRGQLWLGDRSKMMKGEPNRCHSNSCNLWEQNRQEQEVAIATGYALTSDGVWRQHSWLMHRKARSVQVVETTCKRVAYFGFVMTNEEAYKFCDENY